MAIQKNEKYKVQQTIKKIVNNNFDASDIDKLFMSLRAFYGEHKIFKEIAHFIAHNNSRNQGITCESLEYLYLSFKHYTEHKFNNSEISISSPLSSEMKQLIKYQLSKYGEERLLSEIGITKQKLESILNNKNIAISTEIEASIKHLLSVIKVEILYTQQQIIDELIAVIKENNLDINEDALTEQANKIMLCILTLIHDTKYELKNIGKIDNCEVYCNSVISYDKTTNNLIIHGYVPVKIINKEHSICFPILTTNLDKNQWCEESALIAMETGTIDKHIGVSENFKLVIRKD